MKVLVKKSTGKAVEIKNECVIESDTPTLFIDNTTIEEINSSVIYDPILEQDFELKEVSFSY